MGSRKEEQIETKRMTTQAASGKRREKMKKKWK